MFESIWNEVKIDKRPSLKENLNTEIVIIGGGLTGVLIAYYLQKNGKNAVVLEADRIGHGMTLNTTAKITSQHNLIYKELCDKFGEEKAKEYAMYNERAIEEYEKIIKEEHIDCDFERIDSFVYSLQDTKQLEEEVTAAKNVGIETFYTKDTALPFQVAGAVKFPNQAQFHPIKFLKSIADKVTIYEHTMLEGKKGDHILEVCSIQEDGTEKMLEVEADIVILANHYPIEKIRGLYALRMYQERENVVVAKAKDALPYGMYVAAHNAGYSFRKYKDYVIIAGQNHRPGVQLEQNSIEDLEEAVKHYYKDSEICYHMANQDCITLDKVPYIGRFTPGADDVYIATGFNKWGMSHAMVAAMILTEMICEGKEKKNSIFNPGRFVAKGSKEEWKEHLTSVIHHFKLQKIHFENESMKEIKPGCGAIIREHGKKIAVYHDINGEFHCFSARCPHLGCVLEWNQEERSFDCPCHGSRFSFAGELINGPAKDDMKEIDK